jgi:hypothetical protein
MIRSEEGARRAALEQVAQVLRAEQFPMEKEQVYYSVGDLLVLGPSGVPLPVRDVLDRVERTYFTTVEQTVQAIALAAQTMAPLQT